MNNWLKIGLPVLIALLLIVATAGITLAVTGDRDGPAGNVYVPKGATCSNCPGYVQVSSADAGGQGAGAVATPGGCCRGR